jgi:hypothetical protein
MLTIEERTYLKKLTRSLERIADALENIYDTKNSINQNSSSDTGKED